MKWHIVKAVSAHLSDWGYQTTQQAVHKSHCPYHRARHVGIVAGSHAVAAMTSENVSWRRRAAYVAINGITHYAIDSVCMPKIVDQVLHIGVALATSPLIRSR